MSVTTLTAASRPLNEEPAQAVERGGGAVAFAEAMQPGEQLRFIISFRNLLGTLMPGIREYVGVNSGQHIVHTGAARASYLQLPIQTR